MSYLRVMPRDLFNEANLLKCMGKLAIETEKYSNVVIEHAGDKYAAPYDIRQNSADGSIYINNVDVSINSRYCEFYVPLNSRSPWPLWMMDASENSIKVFNDDGTLSAEMIAFIEG